MNLTLKTIICAVAIPFLYAGVLVREHRAQRRKVCPSCCGKNFTTRHHAGNFLAPEC